ncbi:MAG: hypothetical protein ACRCS0_03835 [Albidovulum sp.]
MRLRHQFTISVLVSGLLGFSAAARDLTPEEAGTLDKAAASYLRAVDRGDAAGIVAALPPRVLTVFGAASGIEEKNLQKKLVEQTAELMKTTDFRDVAAAEGTPVAGDAELADGTPVVWSILKTSFVSEVEGKAMQNWQPLLALSEGGKWYFLRVEGPQSKQLAAIAYPFLSEIDFPSAASAPAN